MPLPLVLSAADRRALRRSIRLVDQTRTSYQDWAVLAPWTQALRHLILSALLAELATYKHLVQPCDGACLRLDQAERRR